MLVTEYYWSKKKVIWFNIRLILKLNACLKLYFMWHFTILSCLRYSSFKIIFYVVFIWGVCFEGSNYHSHLYIYKYYIQLYQSYRHHHLRKKKSNPFIQRSNFVLLFSKISPVFLITTYVTLPASTLPASMKFKEIHFKKVLFCCCCFKTH